MIDYNAGAPNNNAVAFKFTVDGRNKLQHYANKQLSVSFTATMTAVPQGGQAINASWLYVAKGDAPLVDEPLPTIEPLLDHDETPITWPQTAGEAPGSTDSLNPPVRSKNTVGMTWSKLVIHKFDNDHQTANLEGTEFEVRVAKDQVNGTSVETEGDAIKIGDKPRFRTGADGKVTLAGLHLHTKSVEGDNPDPEKDPLLRHHRTYRTCRLRAAKRYRHKPGCAPVQR